MKPLVVIPARGGSKRVPNKNIRLLNGKPLINYTIEAALELFDLKQICVSTDDIHIKQVVEGLGVKLPFIRPKELALDESTTHDVLIHALDFYKKNLNYEADLIILLQPTSPFRNAKHIKEALEKYKLQDACEMIVSVKQTRSNPYYIQRVENEDGYLRRLFDSSFTRFQDCPEVFDLNGAIFIINAKTIHITPIQDILNVKKYEMDEISSLDIDEEIDFTIAESILQSKIFANL